MSNFIFVSYNGPDAGAVLAKLLAEEGEQLEHVDASSDTMRRPIGFTLNPDPDRDEGWETDPDEEGVDNE